MAEAVTDGQSFLDRWRAGMEPLQARVERGIVEHRQATASLQLVGADSRPLANVPVRIVQRSHAFGFGANSFMLEGYDTAAKNERWSQRYTDLLNLAVVGFFWKSYEPAPGRLRFDRAAEPMYRRPPVDLVLDWCEAHNLTPKGHNLFWPTQAPLMPDWLPEDPEQWRPLIEKRFTEIAERYGRRIGTWDVVNEAFSGGFHVRAPRGYVRWCYELAGRLFPDSRLFVNEITRHSYDEFRGDHTPYCLLIDHLQAGGCRVDGIGFQHHIWGRWADNIGPRMLTGPFSPAAQLRVLDHYARYGLPIQISEITIGSGECFDDAETIQAEVVRDYYRLWFSHAAIEAAVWWNLADGNAYGDEARWLGGLLREDLSPKPAYEALDQLINHDWRTRLDATTDDQGRITFRGFKGDYEVQTPAATARFHLIDRTQDGPAVKVPVE